MKIATITWKAFGKPTSATLAFTSDWDDLKICDRLFHQTNVYFGALWEELEPKLSPNRTHTALSVGDEIDIDGTVYRCEPVGWTIVDKYEVDNFALSIKDL